jgi:hypothetical protein
MRMPRAIDFQMDENKGNRGGTAMVVPRISTDAAGMSELVDTIAKVPESVLQLCDFTIG